MRSKIDGVAIIGSTGELREVVPNRSDRPCRRGKKENTSRILLGLWQYQSYFSLDQDTHVIADEAVLPGSDFLATANGDHWAVASPVELS